MQFEKTYTSEFFKDFKLHSSFGRAILIVFEKLTRACFFQIALETILLPIQTQSLSVKTVYTFQNVFIFCVILPILSILYQIQHYISMFIVLLTKKLCKLYIL